MATLLAILQATASSTWEGRPGLASMKAQAAGAVAVLGGDREASTLTPQDGVDLLAGLHARGLAPASVRAYYAAFLAMLRGVHAGCREVDLTGWPRPPASTATLTPRQPVDHVALHRWLFHRGWRDTADLLILLRGTGFRLKLRTVMEGAIKVEAGDDFDTLHVGARQIPLVDADARLLIRDKLRLSALRRCSTRTHQRRWTQGVNAVAATVATEAAT